MAKNVITIPATISKYTVSPMHGKKKRKVAAYARVSTDHEEQQSSYEAQVDYYTHYIESRSDWEFVAVYADEGITGCNTKKRDGFNRMVEDALSGRIDLIITKSVSRFARNTVDSLTTIRKLKENGTECYFEKEYIETALYLILIPNTGLSFTYCSIYCGFIGVSEPVRCDLSLICRLNLQVDTKRYYKLLKDCLLRIAHSCAILLFISLCPRAGIGDYYHEAGINNRCAYRICKALLRN